MKPKQPNSIDAHIGQRVRPGRLFDVAGILGVPVGHFYEGAGVKSNQDTLTDHDQGVMEFLTKFEGRELSAVRDRARIAVANRFAYWSVGLGNSSRALSGEPLRRRVGMALECFKHNPHPAKIRAPRRKTTFLVIIRVTPPGGKAYGFAKVPCRFIEPRNESFPNVANAVPLPWAPISLGR